MPETPKKKPGVEPDETEKQKEDSWEQDQQERGYYYDDAHGYEVFNPNEDEEEEVDVSDHRR